MTTFLTFMPLILVTLFTIFAGILIIDSARRTRQEKAEKSRTISIQGNVDEPHSHSV